MELGLIHIILANYGGHFVFPSANSHFYYLFRFGLSSDPHNLKSKKDNNCGNFPFVFRRVYALKCVYVSVCAVRFLNQQKSEKKRKM
jgi:hypothetical protein